jgi:hypothetical protein
MLWDTLLDIANALGVDRCTFYRSAFHFDLGNGDWTVAVTPDSVGRVRLETCHFGEIVSTRWCRGGDTHRIMDMVRESRDEVVTAEV